MNQTPTDVTATAVRVEMARRNIRSREIADILGCSPATVSRRLAGRYPFRVNELAAIADHLGVSLTDLLPVTEDRAA